MGYSTNFEGVLKFKNELTGSQLAYLEQFLGEDRRDNEWGKDLKVSWYHTDLEITKDYDGLQWNGAEKTYELPEIVNFIIEKMQEHWPEFELEGELIAQGEECSDRWKLVMTDNKATEIEIKMVGGKVECPHCGEEFILEG